MYKYNNKTYQKEEQSDTVVAEYQNVAESSENDAH